MAGWMARFTEWIGEIADRHADGQARRTYEVKNGFDDPRNRRERRLARDEINEATFSKAGMSSRRYDRWQAGKTDHMGGEPVRIKKWGDS